MYIIGDVHGCYDTLMALLEQIPDWKEKGICFTGDLCDRGPNTRNVYDFVIKNGLDSCMGNHDLMFANAILDEDSRVYNIWMKNGGDKTLDDYFIYNDTTPIGYRNGDLAAHAEWCANLPLYREYPELKTVDGRYLVVTHNIVNAQWKFRDSRHLHEQNKFRDQVLWGHQYKHKDNHEIYNVTGHWAKQEKIDGNRGHKRFVGARVSGYWACIDSGCGYHGGWLTAMEFPSMKIYTQQIIDEIK